MVDFDTLFEEHGYARFTPAFNDKYACFAVEKPRRHKGRLPKGLSPADFNPFHHKTKLFYYPNALYSGIFGVGSAVPDIFNQRAGHRGLRIADSAGFSFITNPKYSEVSWRKLLLQWQEAYFDVGIILDIPTRAITVPGNGYDSYDMCLARTLDNLHFAKDNQSNPDMKLLSVYQGRDGAEAKDWAKAVAPYPLQGMAIAGDTRLDIAFWLRMILAMIDRGQFDHIAHIHVLGTTQLSIAVMLTAMKRALRRLLGRPLEITFDSSLAFSVAQKYGRISTHPRPSTNGLTVGQHTIPLHPGEFDPDAAFPYRSPIADRCRMRDFLPRTVLGEPALDSVGAHLVSNHTLYMDLCAIVEANRLVDMGQDGDRSPVPIPLQQSIRLIHQACSDARTGEALSGLGDQQKRLELDNGWDARLDRSGDSAAVL